MATPSCGTGGDGSNGDHQYDFQSTEEICISLGCVPDCILEPVKQQDGTGTEGEYVCYDSIEDMPDPNQK